MVCPQSVRTLQPPFRSRGREMRPLRCYGRGVDELPGLTSRQRTLIAQWLPGARLVAEHSWHLVGTTVLELAGPTGRMIVKAGDAQDHHLARELRAHQRWLTVWTRAGRAPLLLHADAAAKLLVTRYLPGRLVEGDPAQHAPGTYRQAGRLLADFHGQHRELDAGWTARLRDRALGWLASPHRIPTPAERALRAEISRWDDGDEVALVPTHGDWQPRNWLIDGGEVRVIDLGRFDLRPAVEDFARLARQDFARDPRLEAAFLAGYGADPREPALWRRTQVTEAIGTAAWAHRVGAESFEQVGLRQIEQLVS